MELMAEKSKAELLREVRELREQLHKHDLRLGRLKLAGGAREALQKTAEKAEVESGPINTRRAFFSSFCASVFGALPAPFGWAEVGADGRIQPG